MAPHRPAKSDAPESPRQPQGTLVIGILGGVAAGKSAAAELLAGPEGRVINADRIAHEVLASPEVTARIAQYFGSEVLGPDGRPDRAALAALVFDPSRGAEYRRALESWTHPRVRATIAARLREARAAGIPRVVLDVPLLLENDHEHNLVAACDALVFVDASDPVRRHRAEQRGWDATELARREAAQLALEEKRDRADFVLPNDSDLETLRGHVAAILARLSPAT